MLHIDVRAALGLATALLVGCGSGSSSNDTPPIVTADTLFTDVSFAGYARPMDVYIPVGATRAVVLLHGGLGTKEEIVNHVGLTLAEGLPTPATVNWAWLEAHHVMLVAPQGQALPDTVPVATWSNKVMDSGQDDVTYLHDLADHIRQQYGVATVYLMGHSMGAMMSNRMWCESSTSFAGYAALSGPASHLLQGGTCAPATHKPYYGMVGELDTVLQVPGQWSASTWTINPLLTTGMAFLDPVLVGEWAQFTQRANWVCGAQPTLEEGALANNVTTWTACSGQLQVRLALQLDHGLGMPEANQGTSQLDAALGFLDSAQ
jgi:polyhydroxybutyrate depolymerase